MQQALQIFVNGEPKIVRTRLLLSELVEILGIQTKSFAIAVNQEVIPHSRLERAQLKTGDRVEIVRAVGGG